MNQRIIMLSVGGSSLALLLLWISYMEGRARFIDHLVVRSGSPIYRGSYYGKCADVFNHDGTLKEMFCATDDRALEPPR